MKTTPDAHLILDRFSLPRRPCQVTLSLRSLGTPAVLRRVSASSREEETSPHVCSSVRSRSRPEMESTGQRGASCPLLWSLRPAALPQLGGLSQTQTQTQPAREAGSKRHYAAGRPATRPPFLPLAGTEGSPPVEPSETSKLVVTSKAGGLSVRAGR